MESLFKIVNSSNILMGSMVFMNDTMEGRVMERELRELIQDDLIYNEYIKKHQEFIERFYILSATYDEDSLALWRLYGDDGKGVAIGLKKHGIEEKRNNNGDIRMGEIMGMECEYVNSIINDNASSYIRGHVEIISKMSDDRKLQEAKIFKLATGIDPIKMKSKYFECEKEYRIAYHEPKYNNSGRVNLEKVWMNGKFGISPFMKIPLASSATAGAIEGAPYLEITSIKLGPKCMHAQENVILQFMADNKFSNNIKISRSEAPYR